MITLSKKTAKLLCARAGVLRADLTVEAQKLYDAYNDPKVSPEQKEIVKAQLDEMIRHLEEKVQTTRRLRGDSSDEK